MDDSEQQFYRGMQKAVSVAVRGGAIINQQPMVAQPNAQSTHMAFSIMPIAALFNAMKRMAFAQMGWLKSNHQPYH